MECNEQFGVKCNYTEARFLGVAAELIYNLLVEYPDEVLTRETLLNHLTADLKLTEEQVTALAEEAMTTLPSCAQEGHPDYEG